MTRISFWKGVMAWVKLASLLFFTLFVLLALPHLGVAGMNFSVQFLSFKLVIVLFIIAYLAFVFSYGRLRLKRRGFLMAGVGHILVVALFSLLFYPIVGFAIALFYLVAAYKFAIVKIGCQCSEMG